MAPSSMGAARFDTGRKSIIDSGIKQVDLGLS